VAPSKIEGKNFVTPRSTALIDNSHPSSHYAH
jgi:hypothetical protein